MDSLMSKLRNLDAYPKINEDFYSRTLSGGLITIASSIFMVLLFLSELRKPPKPFLLFITLWDESGFFYIWLDYNANQMLLMSFEPAYIDAPVSIILSVWLGRNRIQVYICPWVYQEARMHVVDKIIDDIP